MDLVITEEDKPEIERVLAIMDELVRKVGPDYVYEKFIKLDQKSQIASCWYLDNDGKCSCIIGHVLKELGWSMEDIAMVEGSTPSSGLSSHGMHPKASLFWKRLRPNTLRILGIVQSGQDSYRPYTWKGAVESGRRWYEDHLVKA